MNDQNAHRSEESHNRNGFVNSANKNVEQKMLWKKFTRRQSEYEHIYEDVKEKQYSRPIIQDMDEAEDRYRKMKSLFRSNKNEPGLNTVGSRIGIVHKRVFPKNEKLSDTGRYILAKKDGVQHIDEDDSNNIWTDVVKQKVGFLGHSIYLWIGILCMLIAVVFIYFITRSVINAKITRNTRHKKVSRFIKAHGCGELKLQKEDDFGYNIHSTGTSFSKLAWDVNIFKTTTPVRLGNIDFSNNKNISCLSDTQVFDMWSSVVLYIPKSSETDNVRPGGWLSNILSIREKSRVTPSNMFPMQITPSQEWSDFWSHEQLKGRLDSLNIWKPPSLSSTTGVCSNIDIFKILEEFDKSHVSRTLILGPESRLQNWDVTKWKRIDTASIMWAIRSSNDIPTTIFLRRDGNYNHVNTSVSKECILVLRSSIAFRIAESLDIGRTVDTLCPSSSRIQKSNNTHAKNVTRYLNQLAHQKYKQEIFWTSS